MTNAQAATSAEPVGEANMELVAAALRDFVDGLRRDNPAARAWLDKLKADHPDTTPIRAQAQDFQDFDGDFDGDFEEAA